MPTVAILLPVFNGQDYIKQCITSLLEQTFKDFELIVINDGSVDNTMEQVYFFDDPRIKVIHLDRNSGTAHALNQGWAASDSRYVALMDHDDIALPVRLEHQVRTLNAQPRIVIAGSQMRTFGFTEANVHVPQHDGGIKANLISGTNNILNPTAMIRRQAVDKMNVQWKNDMRGIFDWVFWCDLMLHRAPFINLPDILLKYRVHESQQSRDQRNLRSLQAQTRQKLLINLFPYLTPEEVITVEPMLQWVHPPGIERQDLIYGLQILKGMIKQSASLYGEDRDMLNIYLRKCHHRWVNALISYSQ